MKKGTRRIGVAARAAGGSGLEWPHARLAEVAAIVMGQSPPGDTYNTRRDGLPFFQGKAEFGVEHPMANKWCSAPARIAEAGDILLSVRAPVGPTNIARERCCIGRGLTAIRAHPSLASQRYILFVLRSIERELARRGQGSTFGAIGKPDVEQIAIPLPPLSEQHRIVEILDQADHIRRLRTEADARADHILPAVLARALGSPLTWPSHPRSRPLGSLVDPVSGATPSKTNGDYWNGTVPWVSPKDMKRDFLSDAQDHVSELALNQTNLRIVERDNVLIVVRGMILARDVPVAMNLIPVTINQDMKALLPKSPAVTGSYLWAALRLAKTSLQSLIRTAGHGTRKLDTPELMQFPLIEPSAKQLAQVESAVHAHKQYIARREGSRARIDTLFAVLVSRAFDGSLTSSWREAHMQELLQELEHQARVLAEE